MVILPKASQQRQNIVEIQKGRYKNFSNAPKYSF